jgi:hypothetical protein
VAPADPASSAEPVFAFSGLVALSFPGPLALPLSGRLSSV